MSGSAPHVANQAQAYNTSAKGHWASRPTRCVQQTIPAKNHSCKNATRYARGVNYAAVLRSSAYTEEHEPTARSASEARNE